MRPAIAWLGMYDHAAQRTANDRLWQAIAMHLRGRGVATMPLELARNLAPDAAWRHPALLLGQICTRPLREHHRTLQVLAHPVYAGTRRPGWHRALIVARVESPIASLGDIDGARVAVNDMGSNTGHALLGAAAGPLDDWASALVETGSHRASVGAIGRGEADIAAIDEVTLRAIARYEPAAAARVRVIAATPEAPTPPFVTAAGTPHEVVIALKAALDHAIAAPDMAEIRWTLGIEGLVPASAEKRVAMA